MNGTEGARILVVDDNGPNREILSRRLSRKGFRVDVAADGSGALELLQTRPFDLVLLDIMMPDVSGIEVLQRIRERWGLPELPVIMATARTDMESVVEALELGANDYVVKPLDMPVLLARMRTQLEIVRLRREHERIMSLKDEFLAIASHDLRQPLTVILGLTALVRRRGADDDGELIERIETSARRMQRIVEEFLGLEALDAAAVRERHVPAALDELAREAVEQHRADAAERGITLALAPDVESVKVPADPQLLRQVLQNLVENAVRFCRAGDTVQVRVLDRDGSGRVEVVDDGPGLEPTDYDRAFVAPRSLRLAAQSGTRRGLAICRRIVELHDGRIGVEESQPGRGCRFWFELPRRERT